MLVDFDFDIFVLSYLVDGTYKSCSLPGEEFASFLSEFFALLQLLFDGF